MLPRCKKCNVGEPDLEVTPFNGTQTIMYKAVYKCPLCGNKSNVVVGYAHKDVCRKAAGNWCKLN